MGQMIAPICETITPKQQLLFSVTTQTPYFMGYRIIVQIWRKILQVFPITFWTAPFLPTRTIKMYATPTNKRGKHIHSEESSHGII
ncbi:MAG: hypothetical protein ACJAWC_002186 [Yoonia sp.]|jgi:hypothetical protein